MSFPIKGFLETSFVDWTGKITSVVFLPHCNFRCPYCHNHELVLAPNCLPTIPLPFILQRIRRMRRWVDGVCITGGEPTLFPRLLELLDYFKREGLQVKLDTNGYLPEVLEKLFQARLIDYVAMDVKAPLVEEKYSRCCGVSVDLRRIRESIDLIRENMTSYEFRVTVVPTLHTRKDVMQLAQELNGSRKLILQHFSSSHTLSPTLRKLKPYTPREIEEMQLEVDALLRGEVDGREGYPLYHLSSS